jgi:hypothetical protein
MEKFGIRPAYKTMRKNMLEEKPVKNVLNVMNKNAMDLLVCVTALTKTLDIILIS